MPEVLAGFLMIFVLVVGLTGQMIFLRRREESYLDILEARVRTMADPYGVSEVRHAVPRGREEAR